MDEAEHVNIYTFGLSFEPGLSSLQHETINQRGEEDNSQYSFNLLKWTRRKDII
jgi:hypothetical protein